MRLREIAKVPISSDAYSLYVRQRTQANPQVFSLDYGDQLKVYDTSGSLQSSRNWSSKVRCIAVGDVEGEGHDALVGGVGKRILVIDHQGSLLWKIDLESNVIACDARDVDGDDAAEVAVALRNKRVILWNDDKVALFTRKMDFPIADVWLEDMTDDSELELIVADRRGNVVILTSTGYELMRLELGEAITVFAVIRFGKKKLFVTGNHSKLLKIWDIKGRRINELKLSGEPSAISAGVPAEKTDLAYIVVSTEDNRLGFWEIRDKTRVSDSEKTTLQEIEATKTILYRRAIRCGNCGAPTSPESSRCESCGAILEVLDEYALQEYISEALDSITSKHEKIKLKELDRILRRTLPKPASYNLRRSLQTMIEKRIVEGHIDGNVFVRTRPWKIKSSNRPRRDEIRRLPEVIFSLLKKEKSFEIQLVEKKTGIDRSVLRKSLLILLGDEEIEGRMSDNEFILEESQEIESFVSKLLEEIESISK
ncbi:WD40 repeat domain-containing protein [Candidatus Thorarchaeota archaeon]|nr:MAG: WD40 repeat domain-containing protein [Candidatus Thorarchaeota archaeon]